MAELSDIISNSVVIAGILAGSAGFGVEYGEYCLQRVKTWFNEDGPIYRYIKSDFG